MFIMRKSFLLLTISIMIQFAGAAGIQYLYPKPGSKYIPQESILILRLQNIESGKIVNLSSLFMVTGDKSGKISGTTTIASDNRTILFKPDIEFRLSEKIKVNLTFRTDRQDLDTTYSFQISSTPGLQDLSEYQDPLPESRTSYKVYQKEDAFDPVILNGIAIPSDFPWIDISINNNPDPGYIFLNNWGGQPYNVIFDNSGAPIWYLRTEDRRRDFKVQKNGKLSMLIRGGYGGGYGHIVLDNTYTVVDVLRAGAGYATDEHELQILADGHYFVIGNRGETVDMSKYVAGGKTDASVRVCAVQEFTPNHELILNVSAWDLYDIRDTQLTDLTGNSINFPHMNAIDIDEDGHILVSSRHMSEVTKIHRTSGEVIWRLGGAHSDFTFLNDEELNGFRNQHDIRVLGDGHYTVFDNGNLHNPPISRSVEYELNTTAMTATLVWHFRDTLTTYTPLVENIHKLPNGNTLTNREDVSLPKLTDVGPSYKYTPWMGNTQRLPNGNTLINWADATLPKLTEVRPDGSKAFEMDFVDESHCYRLFRFPWEGVAIIPYLVIESQPDRITLLFNKFGDTTIDHYNIYGDTYSNPTNLLATTAQPFVHLTELENGRTYWFRVTAVDKTGNESDFSNEEEIVVNIVEPGTNMLINGDFQDGIDHWNREISGGASAAGGTRDDAFVYYVNNGGSEIWNVQLYQQDLTLIEDEIYTFEFDAWASAPRIIEAKVGKASDPFTNYSQIGMTYITQEKSHYRYTFTMENQSDQDCRVVFNCGVETADVYLDNVSLVSGIPDQINSDTDNPIQEKSYALHGNYPNPFNNSTSIRFSLPVNSPVELNLYDINGRFIKHIIKQTMTAGKHKILFNADNLSSGIYFVQLRAVNIVRDTQKIIYIK
jgi:hypothetical protein